MTLSSAMVRAMCHPSKVGNARMSLSKMEPKRGLVHVYIVCNADYSLFHKPPFPRLTKVYASLCRWQNARRISEPSPFRRQICLWCRG
jgi:hypothetical protein